jgi:hypothetical protein
MEPLVWKHVCDANGWTSIEDPGYGKGYVAALEAWDDLIKAIEGLRNDRGMNVILIAHSQIRTFTDPHLNEAYDRYQLKLNEKASAKFREFVQSLLFATYQVSAERKKGENKAKAFGVGDRIMYTERRPAFDAKNRDDLPFEMPLSWDEYVKAVDKGQASTNPETLKESISGMLVNIKDKKLKKTIADKIKESGDDAIQLTKIKRRLHQLVESASAVAV